MKLSDLKKHLLTIDELNFKMPNGIEIPSHFHLTEIGLITKDFVDCGISVHHEKWATLQLWVANDTNHRLKPVSLIKIIENSDKIIGKVDLDVEIEYQTDTIGRYGLDFDGTFFMLTTKQTACLALEKCGIPEFNPKELISTLVESTQTCCTPGGSCC